jgi:hypothetical protein
MRSVWDLYLDADDAHALIDAVVVLERHRAVREPLPLENAELLLERLERVARYCAEDAVYWDREALDRGEAATVDGGRWGSSDVASAMSSVAAELADVSRHIAAVAQTAAQDLQGRLSAAPTVPQRAATAAVDEARRLLDGRDEVL